MERAKYLIILAICVAFTAANQISINDGDCVQGISYWCQDVMKAKKCNAVDFCIQTVWTNHFVRVDSNPICDDCKEWVTKARDYLEKKQTANEIIKTLEWSCSLCPAVDGREKCRNIIADSVNEILKMLESKMDPDAICSAIHVCNNQELTDIFKNAQQYQPKSQSKTHLLPFTCGQCNHIGSIIERKLADSSNDEVLESLLKICGEMSSLSDSCSSIMFKNFNDINKQLPKLITKKKLCRASCAQHYEKHEGIVDISPAFDDPNIPCELCEQLMLHLREVLIANTTEIEFKNVLEGFCSQIPAITDECISLAEQYYHTIYQYLVDGLDEKKTCVAVGICTSKDGNKIKTPTMPLLSSDLFPTPEQSSIEVQIISDNFDMSVKLVRDGKLCTVCEYTMQLVHIEIGKHGIQDDIIQKVRKQCKKLPVYVRQCEDLLDMFGNQILNAIYQGTNPRLVCPEIKMCPPNLNIYYLHDTAVSDKPTCPFCLLALQEIRDIVATNNTKSNIEHVLDQLCSHLSNKLKSQCVDFVSQYSAEVVDMILANFTPQEACVFIKLCSNEEPKLKRFSIVEISNEKSDEKDFDDNDDDNTKILANPQCELCKEVIKLLEQRVIDIKSKDEIRRELENSCLRLKKFKKECKEFVDKYSDRIVDLVSKELEPEQVCRDLIFCVTESDRDSQDYDVGLEIMAKGFSKSAENVDGIMARSFSISAEEEDDDEFESKPECIICEFIMTKIDEELNDKQRDEDIKKVIKNVCAKLPQTVGKECNQFIDYYFDMIIVLIETTKPEEMCNELKLCPKPNQLLELKYMEIQKDIYSCAICKGIVESMDTIIEDPQVDTNLENLEEKICQKFAGKFETKCHNFASTFGVSILNLMKSLTSSDQICYKLKFCPMSNTGMAQFY